MGILSGDTGFFGLDIGQTAIRVVQLSGKHPNRTVFRYGQVTHDGSLIDKSDDASLSQLADLVRETLVRNQITTRNAVVGIPTNRTFSVVRQFDSLPINELAKSLKFQMDAIIPQSIDRVKVDWAILDPDLQKQKKKDVFVCSAEKKYLQRQLDMLESINLNVMVFEPDALALLRITSCPAKEANLLVDIGHASSDVVAVARNEPRLVTTVAGGVRKLIRSVVNALGISHEQAKELIYRIGLRGDQSQAALTTAIVQGLDNIVVELRKVANNFNQRYAQEYSLNQVVVWGDAIYIPGVAEYFSQQLKLIVVGGDPWQNLIIPENIQAELQSVSSSFAVAVGLAERRTS